MDDTPLADVDPNSHMSFNITGKNLYIYFGYHLQSLNNDLHKPFLTDFSTYIRT